MRGWLPRLCRTAPDAEPGDEVARASRPRGDARLTRPPLDITWSGGVRGPSLLPPPMTTAAPPPNLDHLRALIRRIEARRPQPKTLASPLERHAAERRAEARQRLAFRPRETAAGACLERIEVYPLAYEVGHQPLAPLASVTGETLALLVPGAEVEDATAEDLLFLDIETTGLGGAGAIAFLVATARLGQRDGAPALVLRQYLAASPPEEAAVVDALLEDVALDTHPVLATYNGRGFDAPMLDGRATMHRRRAGFEVLRQFDLLQTARAGYRGLLPSCRLAEVEVAALGLGRPEGEVAGAAVPRCYFNYLRTRDPRWIEPVIVHNALDVLALAGLTARLAGIVTGQVETRGVDALVAGRLLAAAGRPERAAPCFARALDDLPPSTERQEAAARLAALHKSAGRPDLAEPLWWQVAERPGHGRLRAHVELAIYYEHHARDLGRAAEVVAAALDHVERALSRDDPAGAHRWRTALLWRGARVHSKLERQRST
ncbi:MAG: hypothetical protein GEU80_05200 [Dehalococcoidia bacterium]|nr:hypothetical protein [Dehalococcoidia bacterium]